MTILTLLEGNGIKQCACHVIVLFVLFLSLLSEAG